VCNSKRMRRLRPAALRRGATTGSAAIEFAVVAPMVLALLFAIIFIGKMYLDTQTLQAAVESAGRIVVVNSNATQDQLKTAIQNQLGVIGNPTITVSYTTAIISGQSTGHLAATMTRTYVVPLITTYNMAFTADTYIPLSP